MMPIKLSEAIRFGATRAPVLAAEGLQLVGVWELQSIDIKFRDNGKHRRANMAIPSGYLIFTALGRLLAMVTRSSRAQSGAERASEALFRATFAYSGRYRLEDGRWITRVDRTWNDAWTDAEQTRWYSLEGERLEVASAWHLGAKPDDRLQRTVFSFRKMKLRPH